MLQHWDEPLEIEEALIRQRILIAEIQEIECQLGDPRKQDVFATENEYLGWRQSAKWAKTNKLQELRLVK